MKNLIIGVIGEEPLYEEWIGESHDIFLAYYGDNEYKKEKYKKESDYYDEFKGTKINILHKVYEKHKKIIDNYDYVFVPDDDLSISSEDIRRLFEITNKYDLWISQPSIIGYFSLSITLSVPCNILRYTNYVEIMCPCFKIEALQKVHHTMNHNKSCWGIDLLWNHVLDNPKNKLAIIDDVAAIHTRPVYEGDSYSNNKIENAYDDILNICKKYNINHDKIVYSEIKKDMINCCSKQTIFPNNKKIITKYKRMFL